MSNKVVSTTLLMVSLLALGSSVHAAPVKEAPAPGNDPHAEVSKITNTLTASPQTGLRYGDTVTWTARTVFDNVWMGPIPPLPFRSNFVVVVNKAQFPAKPTITARTVPASCAYTEFTATSNAWEFRCGPKVFWQGDTWSLSFTTVARDHLDSQWTNVLFQDAGSVGTTATVVTGGR